MSENSKPSTTSLEAPASWNTRYITPEGFVCQITLRADSGKELLDKAKVAMTYLTENGCKPYDNLIIRPKSNGNGHYKSQSNSNNGNASNTQTPEGANNPSADAHLCPIHNVEMKRWEKDGRIWYSHKCDNGWCTGK